MLRPVFVRLAAAAALALAAAAAPAQVSTIDPNTAVDPAAPETGRSPAGRATSPNISRSMPVRRTRRLPAGREGRRTRACRRRAGAQTDPAQGRVQRRRGRVRQGRRGLADLIEDLLRDRGDPSGYITGREAGGAFIAGVRYGSGTLHHQIEGDRTVYWTGPSVGFDFGANADKVFVLVYNLHDSQRLFRRYPARAPACRCGSG
jgi:hypothetical protein